MWVFLSARTGQSQCRWAEDVVTPCEVLEATAPSRVSSVVPCGEDAVASVDLAPTLRHILWGFSIAVQLVVS